MMTLLEVNLTNWADRGYLAGISVLTVFVILIVLVLVLQIFNAVAKSTSGSTKAPKAAAPAPAAAPKAAAPLADASEADKAAVATALYLYMNNVHDEESGVLTIAQTPSAWRPVLNPRL